MGNSFTTTSATPVTTTVHRYTLADLILAVKHAIGGATDSLTTANEIVNDAIVWFAEQTQWTWLQRPLSLNFVASQQYVTLPTDFKAVHTVIRNSSFSAMRAVTLAQVQTLRATGNYGLTMGYYYSLTTAPQTGLTLLPAYRFELYPTPGVNETGAIIGTYLRQIPKLISTTDVPDMPAIYHPTLKTLCRAMAVSDQFQQAGEDWRRVMDIMPKLIADDGAADESLGSMRGAVDQNLSADLDWAAVRGTVVNP